MDKRCSMCKEVKSFSCFFKRAANRDGYRSQCKVCDETDRKKRYGRRLAASYIYPGSGLCKTCCQEKPGSSFGRSLSTATGINHECKSCNLERVTKWQKNNPTLVRNSRLKSVYGISIDDFDTMLLSQKGGCAICGRTSSSNVKRLGVDHDHKTLRVRGVLCDYCNSGLGLFFDNRETIVNAIRYLSKWEEPKVDVLGRTDFSCRVSLTATTFRRSLGISRSAWESLINGQNGKCAICESVFDGRPHLDHCHVTGAVRGILCHSCNTAIGRFSDSIQLLEVAATYLSRSVQ
jgi:hypothetical protein